MSRQATTILSSAGSRTIVRSTVAGAGSAVAAGTAKAAGLLSMSKIDGVGVEEQRLDREISDSVCIDIEQE